MEEEQLRKAFWAEVGERLDDGTVLRMVVDDVREALVSCCMEAESIRREVNAKLDPVLTAQKVSHAWLAFVRATTCWIYMPMHAQIDQGILDVQTCAMYAIETMQRLCTPARDEDVALLRREQDPVKVLEGIFKTLGLMRLDIVCT